MLAFSLKHHNAKEESHRAASMDALTQGLVIVWTNHSLTEVVELFGPVSMA